MNQRLELINDVLTILKKEYDAELKKLNDNHEQKTRKYKEERRAIIDACEHKNKSVYKDYYSRISTCKDCGIEW